MLSSSALAWSRTSSRSSASFFPELVTRRVELLHRGEHLLGLLLLLQTRLDLGVAIRGIRTDRRIDDDLFGDLMAHELGNQLPEQAFPFRRRGTVGLVEHALGLFMILRQQVDDVCLVLPHAFSFVCQRSKPQSRTKFPRIELEETFLVRTDLVHVDLVETRIQETLDGCDMPFGVRAARHLFGDHLFRHV